VWNLPWPHQEPRSSVENPTNASHIFSQYALHLPFTKGIQLYVCQLKTTQHHGHTTTPGQLAEAARTAVEVQTLKGKIYWSVASKPNPLNLKNSKNSPVCACVAYMHCICACAYCNNTSTIKTFYKYQQLIHSVHFRTPYFICRKSSCPHLFGTSFGSQIQQKNGLTTPSSKALKHWLLRGSPSLRSKEPMSISIVWTHCHINSLWPSGPSLWHTLSD